MIFFLIAYMGETPDGLLSLDETTKPKTALGSGEYEGDLVTIQRADPAFPDFSSVQVGDSVKLRIAVEKIPPYSGEPPAPEKNPDVEATVLEVVSDSVIRLDKTLAMAPKADVKYRAERSVSHTDFDPAAEAAFRAAHPTSSFLKAKMPWYLPQKHLAVRSGKIIDKRDDTEPYGIVYL